MYNPNNRETVTTDAGTFEMEQRNEGFEPNDGRWIVSQHPELFWSSYGTLRQRRPGAFLGVFETHADALCAVSDAQPQPVTDVPVMSIGRVSC